jgi:glycerol-3-phosphate dehydrogenase (NAD(P)+)
VLHGPSHAEEVARQKPTTVVAASPELETARRVQERFMTPMFRVYTNTDLLGVEIAGAVKNVLAIAAGICDGLQLGDNAKAALITRGLAEMARLGVAMGASPLTFAGLAGIGDLVVTCMSRHSRNRYVGEQLGQGRTLEEILSEMSMVAEGVRTAISVRALAQRYGVEMPIATAVYEILFAGKSPQQALEELMSRAAKEEYWTGPLAAYSS